MKHECIPYDDCKSGLDLSLRCMQNALIILINKERLGNTFDNRKVVYHSTLKNALRKDAKPIKILKAFSAVELYCQQDPNCDIRVLYEKEFKKHAKLIIKK